MPQTQESRMAKMKKKIASPLLKRRNQSGGKLSIFGLITAYPKKKHKRYGIIYSIVCEMSLTWHRNG